MCTVLAVLFFFALLDYDTSHISSEAPLTSSCNCGGGSGSSPNTVAAAAAVVVVVVVAVAGVVEAKLGVEVAVEVEEVERSSRCILAWSAATSSLFCSSLRFACSASTFHKEGSKFYQTGK
jgi:hypothetical protein